MNCPECHRTALDRMRRGLCRPCYDRMKKAKTLDAKYPSKLRTRDETLDIYHQMRVEGSDRQQVIDRLGCSMKYLERVLSDAAVDGDPRSDAKPRKKMARVLPPVDPRSNWRDRSECRNEDPELFFPIGTKTREDRMQIATAKAICHRCPVVTSCLSYALEVREEFGVFGGTDEDERRAMLRSAQRRAYKASGGGR